jgi:hypothetical protein
MFLTRFIMLMFSPDMALKSERKVKTLLNAKLASHSPIFIKKLLGKEDSTELTDGEKKKIYNYFQECERWHHILGAVGWFGIFWCHFVPSKIISGSEENFIRFVIKFTEDRKLINELMAIYWKEAPELLKKMGNKRVQTGTKGLQFELTFRYQRSSFGDERSRVSGGRGE